MDRTVGRVIGTRDATPLEFWVGVSEGEYLQLDDVVALERSLPGGERVHIYGTVAQVVARHEGARFDSDVFLIEEGILPAEVIEAAQITATRFEPEIFVPPRPGQPVRIAVDQERDRALFFDRMERRVPVGMARSGEPLWVNLDFVNGERGAHVNISGISGVATKTSYATFLVHSLFTSGVLGTASVNTKALIFNVKGEDLLHLDKANTRLDDEQRKLYADMGLAATAFGSVAIFAPPRLDDPRATADVASRSDATSFFWTIHQFCSEDLLPFLFADAEDERAQYTTVVYNVMAQLRAAEATETGAAVIDGIKVRTFRELADLISERVQSDEHRYQWAGPAIGTGTINAFIRRLQASVRHVGRLVRADVADPERHRIRLDTSQVSVIDIHNLNDRAQRFVVGVTLKRAFEDRERAGQSEELLLVVLDELNKYAPREGTSPIKEILLDVAERGRSLGIILIGAQQTASEVERRVIANSAIRVVGRLDSAEAHRDEYGWLPAAQRDRSTILKPGTMLLSQPERLRALLLSAERPVLIVGVEIHRFRLRDAVRELPFLPDVDITRPNLLFGLPEQLPDDLRRVDVLAQLADVKKTIDREIRKIAKALDQVSLTQPGTLRGSVPYMAPEQAAASDHLLYSVMSNYNLLSWLREYSIKQGGVVPPRADLALRGGGRRRLTAYAGQADQHRLGGHGRARHPPRRGRAHRHERRPKILRQIVVEVVRAECQSRSRAGLPQEAAGQVGGSGVHPGSRVFDHSCSEPEWRGRGPVGGPAQ